MSHANETTEAGVRVGGGEGGVGRRIGCEGLKISLPIEIRRMSQY